MDNQPQPPWQTRPWAKWLPLSRPGAGRWLKVIFWIAVVFGAFRTLELTLFPWLVQRQLAVSLEKLGFEHPTLTVREVTLSRAVIVDIGGSAADPHIAAAVLEYSPISLLHGRLDAINFTGAKVIYDLDHGLGSIGGKTSSASTSPAGTSAPASTANSTDLPFGQIRIQSSDLVIRRADRDYWLPMSGTITNKGNGQLHLDATALGYGSTASLAGDYDIDSPSADLELKINQFDLAAMAAVYTGLGGGEHRVVGLADLDLKFHRDAASTSYAIAAVPREISGFFRIGAHRLVIDRCSGKLNFELDARGRPGDVVADGSVDSVSFDGDTASDLKFAIGPLPANTAASQTAFPIAADSDRFLLQLDASAIALPSAQAALNNVSANLNLAINKPEGGFSIAMLEGSQISAGSGNALGWSIQPNDADGRFLTLDASNSIANFGNSGTSSNWNVAAPIQLAIHQANLASASAKISGIDGQIRLIAKADAGGFSAAIQPNSSITVPTIALDGIDAKPGSIGISGSFARVDGKSTLDAAIHLDKASVHLADGDVTANDISGDFPIHLNGGAANDSKFTIEGVTIGNSKLPGLGGAFGLNGSNLKFTMNWPAIKGGEFQATGDFDLSHRPLDGAVWIKVPEFDLTDTSALSAISLALKDFQVTGFFSADGKFTIQRGQFLPNVTIKCHDANIDNAAMGASIQGLAASLNFTNQSPLETPGDQKISIKQAKFGKLVLTDGTAAIRVEGTNSVLVERSQWSFADGTLLTDAFRISPGSGVTDLNVQGQNLSMQSLLTTFLPGEASGDGRIYGSLPVEMRWPEIRFGQGFVYSAPGTGKLQLTQAETRVGNLMDASDPRFKTDDSFKQIRTRVVSALHDFQYDVIKMDWKTGPSGLVTTLQIQGKGNQANGQVINLNINFTGLDKALARYLLNKN